MKNRKLKQCFGKAKLFEIRRLVRRIRQFSIKKGTEQQLAKNKRKVERLEQQLEALKDARFEEIIAALDKNEDDQQICDENSDAKMLVLSKLTKVLRDEKAQLEKVEEKRITKRSDTSKVEADSAEENDGDDGLDSESSEHNFSLISNEKLEGTVEDETENRSEKLKVVSKISNKSGRSPKNTSMNKPNSSDDPSAESPQFTNSKMEKKSEMKNGKRKMVDAKRKKVIMKRKKKFHEIDIPENDDYISSDDDEQSVRKHLSIDSVFIGSLSNGKQNEKTKRDGKNKKDKHKNKKRKANRLGQRKRQEQWAKLYGNKANHLKRDKRKDKMNERKNKNQVSQKNGDFSKTKKNATAKDSMMLHPSWEASKSKRKQENIVAFEGQKITFDD